MPFGHVPLNSCQLCGTLTAVQNFHIYHIFNVEGEQLNSYPRRVSFPQESVGNPIAPRRSNRITELFPSLTFVRIGHILSQNKLATH